MPKLIETPVTTGKITENKQLWSFVLQKKDGTVKVAEAGYILTWVYTPVEDGKKKFYILPCSEFEDRPEFFSRREDYEKMLTFIVNSRKLLEAQNKGIGEIIFSEGRWLH